ncbi:MAG: hypothetical protein QM725_13290 [Lacibacter sp.]
MKKIAKPFVQITFCSLFIFFIIPFCIFAQPTPTGWACAECGASAPVGTAVQHKSTCSSYSSSGSSSSSGRNTPSPADIRIAKSRDLENKGDAQLRTGHYKKAVRWYRKAYWQDPNNSDALSKIKTAKEKKAATVVHKPTPAPKPKPSPPANNNLSSNEIAAAEQKKMENNTSVWIEEQKRIFAEKRRYPNKWCSSLKNSLLSKAPPPLLSPKKFSELEPGDVILVAPNGFNEVIRLADSVASGGAYASHALIFLKEINGKKYFLDNVPSTGPQIITEDQFRKEYMSRDMMIAQSKKFGVAQPLDKKETEEMFDAAVKMAQENRKTGNLPFINNYGVKGPNNMVCSESAWMLINTAGRKIPGTDFGIKTKVGVRFSPADFFNEKYFLVMPMAPDK